MAGCGEAEPAIGGEPLAGHGDEHGDLRIVVVVHGDVGLARVGPQQATDVLDDPALSDTGEARTRVSRSVM